MLYKARKINDGIRVTLPICGSALMNITQMHLVGRGAEAHLNLFILKHRYIWLTQWQEKNILNLGWANAI